MGQMKVMNSRCILQEKYVSDWVRKMIAFFGGKFFFECFLILYFMLRLFSVRFVFVDFCMDAEVEAADIERLVISNVLFGDDVNRDMFRVYIRFGRVGFFIGRLREVIGRIDKELWSEDDFR